MKIKEVSSITGLTDKAIRTYIRNGLVFPDYDENYLGRKSWNYTESDVKRLKQIAILRKYEFSLKDIKTLFDGEVGAYEFLDNHINELKHNVDENIDTINCMVNVIRDNVTDADELCDKLNNPEIAGKPIPVVDNSVPYKLKYAEIKRTRNILVIIFALGFILTSCIRDGTIYIYDSNCTVSADYSTILYENRTYRLLNTRGLFAEACTTLVEHPKIGDKRHYFKDMGVYVESIDGIRSDEVIVLSGAGNIAFRFYAEESVYDKYANQINNFSAKYLCSIKQNDNGTGFVRYRMSDALYDYIKARAPNENDDIDNMYRISNDPEGDMCYINFYGCDDGIFHTMEEVYMEGFEGKLYYYTDEDMTLISNGNMKTYKLYYHYIDERFYDEIRNMGYVF